MLRVCTIRFAILSAGGVLVFRFGLWLGKLGFVEQIGDLSIQEGEFGLNVFR